MQCSPNLSTSPAAVPAMGFFDDVAKAAKNIFNPDSRTSVTNDIERNIRSVCEPVLFGRQAVACEVIANNCPGLKVTCGNTIDQVFSCTLDDMSSLLGNISDDDAAQLAAVLDVPDTGKNSRTQIVNRVKEEITAKCGTADAASQTIEGQVTCDLAKNVSVNFLNQLDQQALCGAAVVNDLLERAAKQRDAEQKSAFLPLQIVLIVCAVLIVVALVAAIALFASGGKSTSPSRIPPPYTSTSNSTPSSTY